MIIPQFSVSQDDSHVVLTVRVPYMRSEDMEFCLLPADRLFTFSASPYFLRLTLPGDLSADREESASYDVATGILTCRLPKAREGEQFVGLEMLTSLLARKESRRAVIQELQPDTDPLEPGSDAEAELFDIASELRQSGRDRRSGDRLEEGNSALQSQPPPPPRLPFSVVYGFDSSYSGVFENLQDILLDVLQNPSPEAMSQEEIAVSRAAAEDEKFDPEHYVADEFDSSDEWKAVYDFRPLFAVETFTAEENDTLMRLPRKSYLLDNRAQVLCTLVDILYAYCYDSRLTRSEMSVESHWTISTLSPALSWLQSFCDLESTMHALYRRSLAYPLIRSWRMCEKVREDVSHLLIEGGVKGVVRALLRIRWIFEHQPEKYRLNRIFVDDYASWLQSLRSGDRVLASMGDMVAQLNISKHGAIGWFLDRIEDMYCGDEIDT